jgi:exopolyphosphatase/guanosine-5'-triphosphate,3'-diphosphate pyrophosphatase
MLVGQITGTAERFLPLHRRRAYVRLAADCDREGERQITQEARDRVLNVMDDFLALAEAEGVVSIKAVATGVVRDAVNRDRFVETIQQRTGLHITVISGAEEAFLTQKGVLHDLSLQDDAYLLFDLGGGSTEFIIAQGSSVEVRSLKLGCMLLNRRYFSSDPPGDQALAGLSRHVTSLLRDAFPDREKSGEGVRMVGTGGTVTTLAAMLHGIPVHEIDSGTMRGLVIRNGELRKLFDRMKGMPLAKRLLLIGLDRGRADVILAGLVVVMKILAHFGAREMEVSLSDLLEGMICRLIEGDEPVQKNGPVWAQKPA